MSIESMMLSSPLSFATTFFSCPQSSPASGSFPMSLLFASGGQSTEASGTVFPMNSTLISFRIDCFVLLQSKSLKFLQHHNLKASILPCSAICMAQLSHPYMTTGKTTALSIQGFVGKVMYLLFNVLFRFVIEFLPRSQCLLISRLQSPSSVILESKEIKYVTASTFSPSI